MYGNGTGKLRAVQVADKMDEQYMPSEACFPDFLPSVSFHATQHLQVSHPEDEQGSQNCCHSHEQDLTEGSVKYTCKNFQFLARA